jgi:hypothetical protein
MTLGFKSTGLKHCRPLENLINGIYSEVIDSAYNLLVEQFNYGPDICVRDVSTSVHTANIPEAAIGRRKTPVFSPVVDSAAVLYISGQHSEQGE